MESPLKTSLRWQIPISKKAITYLTAKEYNLHI